MGFCRHARFRLAVQQDGYGSPHAGNEDGAGGEDVSGVGVSPEHARRGGVFGEGRIFVFFLM